jgi:hypothetical protein
MKKEFVTFNAISALFPHKRIYPICEVLKKEKNGVDVKLYYDSIDNFRKVRIPNALVMELSNDILEKYPSEVYAKLVGSNNI